MTALYLFGGLLVAVCLAAWLAYRAGRARGEADSATTIATLTAARDSALAARDAAQRMAQAAVDGPRDADDALRRLREGSA